MKSLIPATNVEEVLSRLVEAEETQTLLDCLKLGFRKLMGNNGQRRRSPAGNCQISQSSEWTSFSGANTPRPRSTARPYGQETHRLHRAASDKDRNDRVSDDGVEKKCAR